MGWRLGSIRPVNKNAGALPVIDEANGIVALVLLGSESKNRNVEIILRSKQVAQACREAVESLGDDHPVAMRLLQALR